MSRAYELLCLCAFEFLKNKVSNVDAVVRYWRFDKKMRQQAKAIALNNARHAFASLHVQASRQRKRLTRHQNAEQAFKGDTFTMCRPAVKGVQTQDRYCRDWRRRKVTKEKMRHRATAQKWMSEKWAYEVPYLSYRSSRWQLITLESRGRTRLGPEGRHGLAHAVSQYKLLSQLNIRSSLG